MQACNATARRRMVEVGALSAIQRHTGNASGIVIVASATTANRRWNATGAER
jgi:hypothetical protein